MPRRTATLEDVARAAGVSQQTVSRVLNRPEVVSARTREQVIRAMQALHYVPILSRCRPGWTSCAPSIFAG